MDAYASIYEARRGHAAGSSDLEKQASQLASDVRYKAKGRVKEGTNREELKKIYLTLIQSSPAPNVVKQMAKKKLVGESYIPEEGYDIARDMGMVKPSKDKKDATTTPRKPMSEKEKEESQQKSKDAYDSVVARLKKKYGDSAVITKTTESVLQREMRFDDGEEGTKKRKEALRKKRGMTKKEMDKHPQFKTEEKAPRMQKGAMAYDGPNKERSEAADRILAKAKKKREEKMKKEEYVGEMKVKQVVKPKPAKNPQNMTLPKGVKSGVNYQNMAQSYVPVGNIFNEKKMDPVGQEDKDIDNDGDHDSTDKYLLKRRKAIGKAIAKKRGRVKEGFSAWRIDLNFDEQVKK